MAVDVVDAFEVVHVDHQHRHGTSAATRPSDLGSEAFVKIAMVVETGERVRLRLVLEPCPDLRVVERKRGCVGKSLRKLEFVRGEARILAEPVDVEGALDLAAGDQRNRDERFRLVGRRPGHDGGARVILNLVDQHGLLVLDGPAGEPDAEGAACCQDLGRPAVARHDRDERSIGLVDPVDGERVVGDEIGERVSDAVEE